MRRHQILHVVDTICIGSTAAPGGIFEPSSSDRLLNWSVLVKFFVCLVGSLLSLRLGLRAFVSIVGHSSSSDRDLAFCLQHCCKPCRNRVYGGLLARRLCVPSSSRFCVSLISLGHHVVGHHRGLHLDTSPSTCIQAVASRFCRSLRQHRVQYHLRSCGETTPSSFSSWSSSSSGRAG